MKTTLARRPAREICCYRMFVLLVSHSNVVIAYTCHVFHDVYRAAAIFSLCLLFVMIAVRYKIKFTVYLFVRGDDIGDHKLNRLFLGVLLHCLPFCFFFCLGGIFVCLFVLITILVSNLLFLHSLFGGHD